MPKRILNLSLFELKISKKNILSWSIAIFAITFLYMILFPSIQDMAQIKMQTMPEELMQFMGMDDFSDMGNFVSYFGMIYNIILIAISIFAVTFSAKIIANEEKNKTIEFLYSLQVSRLEIYISKFLTAYMAIIAVICSAFFATIICGYVNGGETFVLMDVLSIIKFSAITPFVFMSIAVMIQGITAKISGASLASMIVVLSYVLGFLSTMVSEKLQWIEKLSPFEVFCPTTVVDFESETMINLMIYFVFMMIFVVVGAVFYRKRDFKI